MVASVWDNKVVFSPCKPVYTEGQALALTVLFLQEIFKLSSAFCDFAQADSSLGDFKLSLRRQRHSTIA